MFDIVKYNEWVLSSRIIQIRYITTLTALLFIVYSEIDKITVPENFILLTRFIHVYAMVPILSTIVILTFFKKYYSILTYLMILAPVGSCLGNLFIISKLPHPTLYLPEIYLSILWVFTISGLKFSYALISASMLVIIAALSFFYVSHEIYILHMFWVFCATSFGTLAAFLLEESSKNIFLNKEALAQLAVTDKLTGLYNRAKFDEVLSSELSRSQRFEHTFGLIMIDIDYFKSINDTYGHHVGDTFLIEIAKLIQESIRSTDILVRWGGEEFVLLCLESDLAGVLNVAEMIHTKIETHNFKTVGKRTVSMGVTMYQEENDTDTTIIVRADNALYEAKNNGRNCIKVG